MTEDLAYRIRRSDRARRVRVSVDAQGAVEVVLPRRSPASAAPAAIEGCARGSSGACTPPSTLRATIAARGATLPYLGEQLTLVPQAGRTRAHRNQDALLVPAEAEQAQAAIERWYRRAAAKEIAPRLDAATARARHELHHAVDPRPAHALGLVLGERRDELQLAAAARPARSWSTSSGTRPATCASWTTRRASGRSYARTARLRGAAPLAAPPRSDAGVVIRRGNRASPGADGGRMNASAS